MKKIFILLFSLTVSPLLAQEISTVDFMKTIDNNHEELIYYYENNWKIFRDIALERGFIESYELMTTEADSVADFDVILITKYRNQEEYDKAEERFQQIIKEVDEKRGGLQLLNEKKPNEFRTSVFNKNTTSIFLRSN